MRLVEDGRISLDTDVNQYLKQWQVPENEFTRKEKVTLRRILSHAPALLRQFGRLIPDGLGRIGSDTPDHQSHAGQDQYRQESARGDGRVLGDGEGSCCGDEKPKEDGAQSRPH